MVNFAEWLNQTQSFGNKPVSKSFPPAFTQQNVGMYVRGNLICPSSSILSFPNTRCQSLLSCVQSKKQRERSDVLSFFERKKATQWPLHSSRLLPLQNCKVSALIPHTVFGTGYGSRDARHTTLVDLVYIFVPCMARARSQTWPKLANQAIPATRLAKIKMRTNRKI